MKFTPTTSGLFLLAATILRVRGEQPRKSPREADGDETNAKNQKYRSRNDVHLISTALQLDRVRMHWAVGICTIPMLLTPASTEEVFPLYLCGCLHCRVSACNGKADHPCFFDQHIDTMLI
jgi:hypothetical protein